MSQMTSEERLATARQLNASSSGPGHGSRLSELVRERLRIRTRRQGEDPSTSTPPTETAVVTETVPEVNHESESVSRVEGET